MNDPIHPAGQPPGVGAALPGALVLAVAGSVALRYGLMESDVLHGVCALANDDWRCLVRRWAPQIFIDHRIGWLALAAGVAAALARSRTLAKLALVGGGAGLVLYSTDHAAAGLLLGLIVLCSSARPAKRIVNTA
ncbi:MAG TPA: hypothetical protein VIO81_14185 [Methyloversatilis sp.]